MMIPLLWLPLLFAHTGELANTQEDSASEIFAQELTELADAGWQLRDVSTQEERGDLHLSVTMVDSQKAQELSLVWNQHSKNFENYHREKTSLPGEERNYAFAPMLLEELSLSAPTSMSVGCGDFALAFVDREVSVRSDDFQVELSREKGQPTKAFTAWFARALGNGELVDLRDERIDNGAKVEQTVVFVVESEEGLSEAKVLVSAKGKVRSFSLHHTPGERVWRRYRDSSSLAEKLEKSGGIASIEFGETGAYGSLRLQLKSGEGSAIEILESDFEEEEGGCDC